MEAYPRAARERAMKLQDVMLQAMAKKITWWQAAEILGISDRHMRRIRERYVERGLQRVAGPAARPAFASPGGGGDRGESIRLVPGKVFRFERAALSREVAGRTRDRTQMQESENLARMQ